MLTRKRHRHNWRARQGQPKSVRKVIFEKNAGAVDTILCGEEDEYAANATLEDTNSLVLPAKKKKSIKDEDDEANKKKKLSSSQRKRLQKIVEAKERKAKHSSLLKSLSTLALPKSQMDLLLPSVAINKGQRSKQQILLDAKRKQCLLESDHSERNTTKEGVNDLEQQTLNSMLTGTSWRKRKRKRRQLKAEKIAYDPKPAVTHSNNLESVDESDPDEIDEKVPSTMAHSQLSLSSPQEVLEEGNIIVEELSLPGSVEQSASRQVQTHVTTSQLKGKDHLPLGDHMSCKVQTEMKEVGQNTVATKHPLVARQPAEYVQLERDPEMQTARLSLPILGEEHVIMEAINDHPVVVLCGETGSGKTTQVPQFLYEAGYTKKGSKGTKSLIGITEPRRVAAVNMSKRVAKEMNLTEKQVSYQIRYEGNTTDDTVVKFMTDGVLLKEIEQDFLLSKYSVIILDEAHERSVFTDILIGLLSRIVPHREKNGVPLKLVIMSATLRVEDFTDNQRLFSSPPPVIKVESRQYPVTVHFNKKTPDDYVTQAYQKICKIHRTLPAGGILVFVTGQMEVHRLCRQLRRTFSPSANTLKSRRGKRVVGEAIPKKNSAEVDLDNYPVLPAPHRDMEDEEGWNLDEQDSGDDSDGEMDTTGFESVTSSFDSQLPLLVLPLYSLLPAKEQAKVFQLPPEGVRVCVVATNVAETSLTIPGVKYVVDTGKVKKRFYDKATGVSAFRVVWTSKASCDQRAGRAGRTEPGHCYRLFSSAVFNNEFDQFSPPEMTRRPVDDLVLQMKAMNIDKIVNFPFPSPPSSEALKAAERLLIQLGAVSQPDSFKMAATTNSHIPAGVITPLGKTMAQFPVAPRYGKMLMLGRQHGCLPYVIAMVAALSVREIFVESSMSDEEDKTKHHQLERTRRAWSGRGESQLLGDLMVLLRAVGACEYAICSQEFCHKNGLRHKAMVEVRKLRQQLTNAVNVVCPDAGEFMDPKMVPPSNEQTRYLRQIVLSGLGDHVARKISTVNMNVEDKKRLRYAYQCSLCEDPVYLHSSSALYHVNPDYVVFQEIRETSKLFMRCVTAIEESWLPVLQPQYCTFSSPMELPPPFFDDVTGTIKCHMTCTYGDHCWPITAQELPYPDNLDRYRLFGQFFMQGKVIPTLSVFSSYLLVAPITMLKKWSKLHKACEVMLNALVNREVYSREKLLETWKEDPKYLLKAYSMWLPESKHKDLSSIWPPTTQPQETQ